MEVSAAKVEGKSESVKNGASKSFSNGLINQIKQLGDVLFAGLMDSLKTDPQIAAAKPPSSPNKVADDKDDEKDLPEDSDKHEENSSSSSVATSELVAASLGTPQKSAPDQKQNESAQTESKEADAVVIPANTAQQSQVAAEVTKGGDESVAAEATVVVDDQIALKTIDANSVPVPADVQKSLDENAAAKAAPLDVKQLKKADSTPTNASVSGAEIKTLDVALETGSKVSQTDSAVAPPAVDVKAAPPVAEDAELGKLQAQLSQSSISLQVLPALQSASEYLSKLKVSMQTSAGLNANIESGKIEATGSARASANNNASSPQLGFSLSGNGRSQASTSEAKQIIGSRTLQNMDRIENALKEAAKAKDGSTLSFRLDPPNLGSVRVDVTVKDNTLIARIGAEHPEVQQLLRERLGDLQQVLAKTGMEIERIKVVLRDQPETGGFFQGDGQKGATKSNYSGASASFALREELLSDGQTGGNIEDHWVA